MITDDEIEALRERAEESKHKRGTLGLWARRWLALYDRLQQEKQYSSALNDELAAGAGSNVYARR